MSRDLYKLAKHLREECDDAVVEGDGRINTTRVMEIVAQYAELGTPCQFCGKEILSNDPCESYDQSERCHAMQDAASSPVQQEPALPSNETDAFTKVFGTEDPFEDPHRDGWIAALKWAATQPQEAVRKPLNEFQRMKLIGEEFPLALVEPIIIRKIDSVVLLVEAAHGIGTPSEAKGG